MIRPDKQFWRLCGLAVMIMAGGAVPAEGGAAARRAAIRKAVDRLNVDFVIRGQVVDQDGKPLDGVTVEVRRTRSVWMFRDKVFEEMRVVNGTFEFKYKDTQGIGLTFKHEGYHRSSLGFGSLEPPPEAHIEGELHKYEQVTAVLQKIGELTSLTKHRAVLSWTVFN